MKRIHEMWSKAEEREGMGEGGGKGEGGGERCGEGRWGRRRESGHHIFRVMM